MKHPASPLRVLAALLWLATAAGSAAAPATPPVEPPPDPEVARRVDGLLGRMTLEEKIGQLVQIGAIIPGAPPEETLRKGGAGSVLWLNDTRRFNAPDPSACLPDRGYCPTLPSGFA